MAQDSVIDTSKPSPGRMYDYFLGGSHNFEVDRQAAEQVLKILPFVTKYNRLQRWTLQDLATRLTGELGFDTIIDFASGLPTNDHIHHKVLAGTTVIYSDYDPVLFQYSHEILGNNTPNVYYIKADARRPEELLNSPDMQQILGDRRKVAFVFWGISSYFPDEDIIHAAQAVYDWAAPGSYLAFNAQTGNPDDPGVKRVIDMYTAMGSTLYCRPVEAYPPLLKPWTLEGKGFIPLLEWHGFEQSELGKEDVASFGPLGGGYGAYLTK